MATITIPSFQGKKTYITAIVSLAYIWLDHFYGIGLSDTCKAALANSPCVMPLDTAIQATLAVAMAVFIRSGMTTETKAA